MDASQKRKDDDEDDGGGNGWDVSVGDWLRMSTEAALKMLCCMRTYPKHSDRPEKGGLRREWQ